jgi:hypothetical protein
MLNAEGRRPSLRDHHLRHNKRAAMLKALLLVRGDEDIVVINVPWYLAE